MFQGVKQNTCFSEQKHMFFFTSHLVQDRLPPLQLHYSRSVALFHTDMPVCLLEVPWQGWCVGGYLLPAWISAADAGQQRWRHPPRR